jgi:hypothetical protein
MASEEEELFARIAELDASIGKEADALSRAESKHESADLWARIRTMLAERRELYTSFDGLRLTSSGARRH